MVRILRHCLVDDSGTVVNPTLVEANLHGATAQAIGGGLFEQIAYDDAGQVGLHQGGVDHRPRVVDQAVAQDPDHAGLRVDLDHAGGGRARPGGIGVEAALSGRLVVDVGRPEVAGRLQPRLDAVGVGTVGTGVDLGGRRI